MSQAFQSIMTVSRDTEQAVETKGARSDAVSTIGTSSRTRDSIDAHSGSSKSVNVAMSVDASVIQLMGVMDDDSDDEYKRVKDPIFGCCCDLIKVCLVVDCIYMMQKINVGITVVLELSVVDPDEYGLRDLDDDEMQAQVARMDMMKIVLVLKEFLGIPFAAIGIYGAAKFKTHLVLCMAIWCCVDLVWSVMTARWLSSIYVAFYINPHFALFMALRSGKISRENYRDKKHCCCAKRRCCAKEHDDCDTDSNSLK
jgi:hypothetical protein